MTRALARVFAIYQPSPERVVLDELQPPKKGAKKFRTLWRLAGLAIGFFYGRPGSENLSRWGEAHSE